MDAKQLEAWLAYEIKQVERKWDEYLAESNDGIDVRKCGVFEGERNALERVRQKLKKNK